MANIYLGDLIQTGKFAYEIYKKSFDENLSVDKQYADFLNIIKISAETIKRLEKVINNAVGQYPQHLAEGVHEDSYIKSFREIVGDYRTTIVECHQLCERIRPFFSTQGGFNQLKDNVTLQKDVERLTLRIDVFVSKITFLLKPLEIDILNRIFQELRTIEEMTRQIRGILVGDISAETARRLAQQPSVFVEIPPDVRLAFEQHASTVSDECFDEDGDIIIPKAADAIAYCLRHSTRRRQVDPDLPHEDRMPLSIEYLNLLKCVWLLEKIEVFDFVNIQESSHWPGFFHNLRNETSRECRRFLPNHSHDSDLCTPDPLTFTSRDCIIWHIVETATAGPMFTDSLGMMDEILELKDTQLMTTNPSAKLSMRLFKGSESRFRVLFITEKRSRQGQISQETSTCEFSARTARLVPLYAHPSRNDGFSIELWNDFKSSTFKFSTERDARLFQQAVTGYKVYYFHGPVGVSLNYTRPAKKELRRACIQLWIPRELAGAPSSAQDVDDELKIRADGSSIHRQSQSHPRDSRTAPVDPDAITPVPPWTSDARNSPSRHPSHSTLRPACNRHASISTSSLPPNPASLHSGHGQVPGLRRWDSAQPSPSGSSFASIHRRGVGSKSGSSGDSIMSVASKTVTMLNHGNTKGFLHRKPLPPMLVLFTHDVSPQSIGEGLSIITVQLNHDTSINYERCNCKKLQLERAGCNEAVIEYSKGKSEKDWLQAQVYNAHDLRDFDVTRPGVEKRQELPADRMECLHSVNIIFPSSDRKTGSDLRHIFGGYRCKCKPKTQKELMACQQAEPTHRGRFGDVRDIGLQELRDFRGVQNMRKDIVVE